MSLLKEIVPVARTIDDHIDDLDAIGIPQKEKND